jgi:hypothetical protein
MKGLIGGFDFIRPDIVDVAGDPKWFEREVPVEIGMLSGSAL